MISKSDPGPVDKHVYGLLQLVADHPWANTGFYQVVANWQRYTLERAVAMAAERGWIERVHVPSRGRRPPLRLSLTRAGANVAGRDYSSEAARLSLLRIFRLDPARVILAQLHIASPTLWSYSPFTLPVKAIYPVSDLAAARRKPSKKTWPRLSAVTFEALAALQVRPAEFANVAVLVDPGGVSLDAFSGSLRSFLTWRSRWEFQAENGLAPANAFPVLIFVAADQGRQAAFGLLWQRTQRATYSRYDGAGPFLRTLTHQELVEWNRQSVPLSDWGWGTQRGLKVPLWTGVVLARRPSLRPLYDKVGWWGNGADSTAEASRIVGLNHVLKARAPRRGILPSAQHLLEPPASETDVLKRGNLLKGLVRDHLLVSGQGQWLLELIGRYPLISPVQLREVSGVEESLLYGRLRELASRGLIVQPPRARGYGLTWRGMALLSFQAGFEPTAYAKARAWFVATDDDGRPRLSLDNWLRALAHTETILAFLAGLTHSAPAAGLCLAGWDHTPWPEVSAAGPGRALRLTPDARGVVRTLGGSGPAFQTTFWLEVDRSTNYGRRLVAKLARYYLVGGPRAGVSGRAERLLIVVKAHDEGRLQSLARRFRQLDAYYGTRLEVLLTRLDLLEDERGRLDPTRKVWRTVRGQTFCDAFSQRDPP